jgi:hypothetical protein
VTLTLPWLRDLAAAAFTIAVITGAAAIASRAKADRPARLLAVYLTSLLFGLPAFVFTSPYQAVGGMTVAHGAQYLLLVGIVAGTAKPGASKSGLFRLAVLANVALIGGAALSLASHLHDAVPAGRLVFGGYLGITMAHFVIDAGIWRMRDPLARKFVTEALPFAVPARAGVLAQPAATVAAR